MWFRRIIVERFNGPKMVLILELIPSCDAISLNMKTGKKESNYAIMYSMYVVIAEKKININYQFKEINSQKKFGKDLLPVLRDTPQ